MKIQPTSSTHKTSDRKQTISSIVKKQKSRQNDGKFQDMLKKEIERNKR